VTWHALANGQGTLIPGNSGLLSATSRLLAEERQRLIHASLFAASAQMTRLALAAASSLPTRRLASATVPARYGLMVFGAPIAAYIPDRTDLTVQITAVSWGPFHMRAPHWAHLASAEPGGPGPLIDHDLALRPWLWVTFWSAGPTEREVPKHLRHVMRMADPEGAKALLTPLRWDNENLICLDLPEGVEPSQPSPGEHTWLDVVCAAWRLMADSPRVVGVDEQARPRGTEKRDARAGYDPGPVRVVYLHRQASAARQVGSELGQADQKGRRHLTERHDVTGHWRFRNTPNPIWVDEYERGPKDAPKRESREKVTVWDRSPLVDSARQVPPNDETA
jgi:hypothetical protein